ncbi:MAG: S8 family serine peptidase [Pirellulaceae bacterium]
MPRRGTAPANRDRDPLLKGRSRVLRFETRLALSASATADVLLDLWDYQPLADNSASGGHDFASLISQASQIHQDFGFDGSGQTVAVIDSGIAYDHIALGKGFGPGYRVVGGWDFAENDANPYDDGPSGFHGTHVAGLLAGKTDSFSGVAPGADLVALRVFDDFGAGNLDWVEDALSWVHDNRFAFENPITTVNLSLGATLSPELAEQVHAQLEDELRLLRSGGIMVFAAAGNAFNAQQPNELAYPASSEYVVPVSSVNESGFLSSFSQRSDGILAAPGEMVSSAVPDHVLGCDGRIDDFVNASGTSMASPQLAGAAMLVRDALISAGQSADPDVVYEHLLATSDRHVDSATGITYYQANLTRAIEQLIVDAHPETTDSSDGPPEVTEPETSPGEPNESSPASAIELGTIDYLNDNLRTDQWYAAEASRDGLLSFVAPEDLSGNVVLTFEAADGQRSTASLDAANRQVDLQVESGHVLRFQVSGTSEATVALEMANVVSVADGVAQLTGTNASDAIHVDLRTDAMVRFGNFQYQLGSDIVTQWQIVGGGGSDSLDVVGSDGIEKVTLHPGNGSIESRRVDLEFESFERVHFDGGGGADRAYLYDSSEDDQLSAKPGQTELTGVGFENSLVNVYSVYVHATAGGNDTAYLYDSPNDDTLAIRPNFTSLRGDTFFNMVYGFDRVNAYGNAGGFDSANLYDSSGDDRMSANASSAFISGPGYFAQARHFESVIGHATAGGNDLATLYADSAEQTLHNVGGLVQLDAGQGMVRAARGFEVNETFLNGSPIIASGVGTQPLSSALSLDDSEPQTEHRIERLTLEKTIAQLRTIERADLISAKADVLWRATDGDQDRDLLDRLFAEL